MSNISGPVVEGVSIRIATRAELELALSVMLNVALKGAVARDMGGPYDRYELARLNDATEILTAVLALGVEIRGPIEGFWHWPSQEKIGQVALDQKEERDMAQARAEGKPYPVRPKHGRTYLAGELMCLCDFGKKGKATRFCKHMVLSKYLNVAVDSLAQVERAQAQDGEKPEPDPAQAEPDNLQTTDNGDDVLTDDTFTDEPHTRNVRTLRGDNPDMEGLI